MQIFEEALFFKLRTKTKTKQNKKQQQIIQLILCQLDVGGWRKEKGTRLTEQEKEHFLERGLLRKFARFVLFCRIKKPSFNLLCVLDLFFRTLAVNSVSDFFYFFLNKGQELRENNDNNFQFIILTHL